MTMTKDDYQKLMKLYKFVKDKRNLSGQRRMAMYEFDYLYKKLKQKEGD